MHNGKRHVHWSKSEFMLGNYAAATNRARIATTANTKVPFFAVLLSATLAQGGHRNEALQVINEFKQRHPTFDSASIGAIGAHVSWSCPDDAFVASSAPAE